jgi:2-methylcitrate dehydratase PrpD
MTIAQDLARFIAGFKTSDVPNNIKEAAKTYIRDGLAIAIGGRQTSHVQRMLSFAREYPGPSQCTIIGYGDRMSPLNAALVNGVMMRALNFDDALEHAQLHVAPPVIASALALGERENVSGEMFIAAVIAGYEVTVRFGEAMTYHHFEAGWHPTSTLGVIGAAATASRILGLDIDQTANALALGAQQASGMFQTVEPEWRQVTSFDGGRAAQQGVVAASLARHGYQGVARVFEGFKNFFEVFAPQFNRDRLTENLGQEWVMPHVGLKPYPTSRMTHPTIDVARGLKKRFNPLSQDIERIVLRGFNAQIAFADNPNIQTDWQATLSHQFLIAVALSRGTVTLSDISSATINDPVIRTLMSRVELVPDPELQRHHTQIPNEWPTILEVTVKGGKKYEHKINQPIGSAANPMSEEDLVKKFQGLVEPAFGKERAHRLLERIATLEKEQSLHQLTQELQG